MGSWDVTVVVSSDVTKDVTKDVGKGRDKDKL